MLSALTLLFFVLLNFVQCQDPRKRFSLELNDVNSPKDDLGCVLKNCLKRSPNVDDMGPFWANRGKKDPSYIQEKFYVDEPHWILVRKDPDMDPFFTSRGKKHLYLKTLKYNMFDDTFRTERQRRDYAGDVIDPAFFAARGKKFI